MFNSVSKVAIVAAATMATSAIASTTSGVMPVTATIVNACAVVPQPLVFGTLSQISGSATDSQTTVVVTCTPGTAYDVGMDNGTHNSAGSRHMQAVIGSAQVPYALYSNASRTTAWGNIVGTDTVSGTANVTPTTLTVYGRIPGGAALVAAGAYTDTVTVTVTF